MLLEQSHHEFQCTDPVQTIPRDNWQHCTCVVTFKLLFKKVNAACVFNADIDQKLWILLPLALKVTVICRCDSFAKNMPAVWFPLERISDTTVAISSDS